MPDGTGLVRTPRLGSGESVTHLDFPRRTRRGSIAGKTCESE